MPTVRWIPTIQPQQALVHHHHQRRGCHHLQPLGVTGSAAFVQAPPGTLGNASLYQNQYRQPWYRYEAVSLNKLIAIWGEGKVSLRYTLYVANPFQRTGFGGITSGSNTSSSINSSNFGRPTGPADGARQMSMGLRLYF